MYGVPGTDAPTASAGRVPGFEFTPISDGAGGIAGATPGTMQQIMGRTVRATAGTPSQELVAYKITVTPWRDGVGHKQITEGQVIFARRNEHSMLTTTVQTLPQLNTTLRRTYELAMSAGGLESARRLGDHDTFRELIASIDDGMEDDLERERRLLAQDVRGTTQQAGMYGQLLRTASKHHMAIEDMQELIVSRDASRVLLYLSAEGIVESWNYAGVVRNVDANDNGTFRVLNAITRGPYRVHNYWGDKPFQGANVRLLLTRHYNTQTQEYEHFEYRPWIQRPVPARNDVQLVYPSYADTLYTDVAGYERHAMSIRVGQVNAVLQSRRATPEHALKLAAIAPPGKAYTGAEAMDAWREASGNLKSRLLVTIGVDPLNRTA